MSLPFDPVELAMLHAVGYFGVPADKLEEIVEAMSKGKSLSDAAWDCGIDPANLTQEDMESIRNYLDYETD